MPSITIRNVPAEVHQGLRARAAKHGRSAESEIRDILAKAVLPEARVKLGSFLSDIGKSAYMSDSEIDSLTNLRDKTPASPVDFE
jgi:plasmid stability protein